MLGLFLKQGHYTRSEDRIITLSLNDLLIFPVTKRDKLRTAAANNAVWVNSWWFILRRSLCLTLYSVNNRMIVNDDLGRIRIEAIEIL
jgi:hypothetical protein